MKEKIDLQTHYIPEDLQSEIITWWPYPKYKPEYHGEYIIAVESNKMGAEGPTRSITATWNGECFCWGWKDVSPIVREDIFAWVELPKLKED